MKKDTLKRVKSAALALAILSFPLLSKAEIKRDPDKTIIYEIKRGDNLIKLSKMFYDGNPNYYDELALLNGVENPDLIRVGNFLLIPPEEILIELGEFYSVKYDTQPVDLENKENLNNKYYALKKGENFNKAYNLVYGDMFDNYDSLGVSKYELRDSLYIYNQIEDPYNLPVGYKIFLLEPEQLILLTNSYKQEGKILKKTR